MKLSRFLMSFTVALGLGFSESPKNPALAQAQLSEAYLTNPLTAPEVALGTIGTAIVADQISPGAGIAFGQPANQPGTLTPKQQASLKSLGIAIAVPSFIPAGYTVSKVEVKPCPANAPRSDKGTCRFGPQYGIVYRNAQQDRCFAIEATGGGIGGVPAEYEVKINTQLLGETSLLFGQQNGEFKTPSSQQLNSPQPNLLTDWAGVGPFYRISGAEVVQKSYYKSASTQCRNTITPNEATKIVRSLSWLKSPLLSFSHSLNYPVYKHQGSKSWKQIK
ncbi:MAG: hypothetical protein KME10_29310 [Plectolyngbya sp. WJT66-NPBG17]|jgi:hypothetical protein|nr:hypothetical protein [Plectolyngbya sp. WJT66-NPBG17]MBW4527886.1 hypothetical protein [Phormidium tanganyikae FI6-MK23]